MKNIILSIAFICLSSMGFAQCLANHKEALKKCEGIYLKHFEFSTSGQLSVRSVLLKGETFLLYVLNTNLSAKHYQLQATVDGYSYPLVNYEKNNDYLSYIITPEKTQEYSFEMIVDTNATACALIGFFHKKSSGEANVKLSQKENPLGTVKVANNLYFDKTEVRNIDYREYLYWLKRIHGLESDEYKKAFPDTTIWRKRKWYKAAYAACYLRHPAYAEYPVVGVSYEQAVDFCQWRSDRVNERIYMHKNNIKPSNRKPIESVPEVVKYRLPTKAEWEQYAAIGNEERVNKKLAKNYSEFGNFKLQTISKTDNSKNNASISAHVNSYLPNKLGIYNMFGNVAEMVAEKGIAKGGSWQHTESETTVKRDFVYTEATEWLGFRCVCEKAEVRSIAENYVKIAENLFASKYETTNKEYGEFIAYLKQKGDEELLKKCMPDSTQWEKQFSYSYNEPMAKLYAWHPSYNQYPVVNITKEAMEEYCKWKTNAFFTTKEFPLKKVTYRLPTEEEWKKLASPKLGHTLPWHGNSPYKEEGKECNCAYANLKVYNYSSSSFSYAFDGEFYTGAVGNFDPNDLGIYDVIGNVAEMTQEGIIKGGGWSNSLEESDITKSQDFKLPYPTVGFRVVVEVVDRESD